MNVRALRALTRSEARLFVRDYAAGFWTLAFPTLLLVVLGCVPSFRKPDQHHLHGLTTLDLYAPILVIMTVTMLATSGLPSVLTAYREVGVLRRLAVSPVPAATLLGALALLYLGVALVSLALVTAVGRLAFRVPLPGQPLGLLLALLFATASLFAVGLLTAALARNAKTGNVLGMVLFYPLMFFSGLWLPRDLMPAVLRRVSDFLPSGAAVQAVQDAWRGQWPHLGALATMAAFALVAGAAAARFFRWE